MRLKFACLKFNFLLLIFFPACLFFIGTIFIYSHTTAAFGQESLNAQNEEKAKLDDKNKYYEIKMVQNEIEILRVKLEEREKEYQASLKKQEEEYQQKLQEFQAMISDLELKGQNSREDTKQKEEKTLQLTQDLEKKKIELEVLKKELMELEKQSEVYNQTLIQKDKENEAKIKEITDTYTNKMAQFEQKFDEKLMEKYKQLEVSLREKELSYAQQVVEKENELKALKEQAAETENMLRQALAKKEVEFSQKLEEEKNNLTNTLAAQKKTGDQLKIYLVKLKEEVKLRDSMLKEKEEQITLLNQKLAIMSEAEVADKKKFESVVKDELEIAKKENGRLQEDIKKLKYGIIQLKDEYEKKIAGKNILFQEAQQQAEVNVAQNSSQWQVKLQEQEEKYKEQLREKAQEKEKTKQGYESSLQKLQDELQNKINENEALMAKLSALENSQIYLLESLETKAEKIRKSKEEKATGTRQEAQDKRIKQDGSAKEKSKFHFERSMAAIAKKNYAQAKKEIEQVLLIEPDNQLARSILENLNFLLERKK